MDLSSFKIIEQADSIGAQIWEQVICWNHFEKVTVGSQFVRAADSISANLSEALGRFTYADRKRFAYYSRGSLYETLNWLDKSNKRGLIEKEICMKVQSELSHLAIRINSYIKHLKNSCKH